MMELNSDEQGQLNLDLTLHSTSAPAEESCGFFLCVYCGRKFYSSQALGGHQNAHKDERRLARLRRENDAATRAHAAAAKVDDVAATGNQYSAAGVCLVSASGKTRRIEKQLKAAGDMPEYCMGRGADNLDLSLRL